MAKRGISISIKLISISTLLIIIIIGTFSIVNSMQTRRIIDTSLQKLRDKISDALVRAGTAQLELLAETTRIAMVQSDYTTLQTIVKNIGEHDERVSAVAVMERSGTVLAHSDSSLAGSQPKGALEKNLEVKELKVEQGVMVGGKKSITFAMPVFMKSVRLCTVFLAYSLQPLEAELAKAEDYKRKEAASSVKSTLLVGILIVLFGLVLTIIQGVSMSRPIRALARQADQMASGDLLARVNIKSRDEIGFLGERFNYMAEQMLVLMKETVAKASMEKELEVASAIQSTLVPEANVVDLQRIQLAGFFKPATQCGGDWWNFYNLNDNRVLVLVGDVTGHGVGSAMITASAQGAVSSMMAATNGQIELKPLLEIMNAAIHATAKSRFVMTCFAYIFDPNTMSITYANAGHTFPYYFDTEKNKLVSIVVRGNRLGDLAGSEYETRQLTVKPQDSLVVYTDGIVECEDIRGEEYGERRFRKQISLAAHLKPDQTIEQIVAKAYDFYGDVPQKDDITLVVSKFS